MRHSGGNETNATQRYSETRRAISMEFNTFENTDVLTAIESNKSELGAKISHLRFSLGEEQRDLRRCIEYCEGLEILTNRLDDELSRGMFC